MLHRVIENRQIHDDVFLISIERKGLSFRPGQYLMAGPAGFGHLREYSIASPPSAEYLRILIKRVEEGFVSPGLALIRPGELLEIRGPFGEFLLPPDAGRHRLLFAATGTGIAPFCSFTAHQSGLDYTLLHGARYDSQDYLLNEFEPGRTVRCLTRGTAGFRGRLTDYFLGHRDELGGCDMIYACGNSDMVYELFRLARGAGFTRSQLRAEVYF